jgi:outer membrane protein OmpA-like peptidoglycan-associated protein
MTASRTIAPALLVALLLATPGCLVSRGKFNKLKAENGRLTGLLDERESELASAQDSFRKRVDDLSREIDLYKKQATGSSAEAQKARAALAEARKKAKTFEDQIRALGVGEVRDGRLVLQAALLFGLGDDTLSPQGRPALDKVAAAFKGKDVLIQIDGHTDTTAIVRDATKKAHRDNMGLSAHRALAVFRYLAAKGIAERNMYIRGFGPHWPVVNNATAASKAKNRRVEILFIPAAMVPRTKAK